VNKVLVGVAAAPVVLVLGVLGAASTRPDTFKVERHATINAPAAKIAPHLTNFHQWEAWSPWEKLDPNLKRTFSGAPEGKGAIYEWDGNDQVGKGRMEILDLTPAKVSIKLDFIRPFEGHNMAIFDLAPKGEATDVTWSMNGPQPLMAKVFGLFMSMDAMVGKDFEKGLAQLKAVAEQK
jgi:hypothetical protein